MRRDDRWRPGRPRAACGPPRGVGPTGRRGLTLVEVLAATVILGTLLVSALVARGRYLRQAALAADKRRAVEAAEAILVAWAGGAAMPSTGGGGPVPGEPTLAWRTRVSDPADAAELGARVLRLEIWPADPSPAASAGATTGGPHGTEPLASVELVVPRQPTGTASPAAHDFTEYP